MLSAASDLNATHGLRGFMLGCRGLHRLHLGNTALLLSLRRQSSRLVPLLVGFLHKDIINEASNLYSARITREITLAEYILIAQHLQDYYAVVLTTE